MWNKINQQKLYSLIYKLKIVIKLTDEHSNDLNKALNILSRVYEEVKDTKFKRNKISEQTIAKIIFLRKQGTKMRTIARICNVSLDTAHRRIKEWQDDQSSEF